MNTVIGRIPEAVLWDMDGVLVDTAELHYLTWKSTLVNHNIPISRVDFNNTFGMNNGQVLTCLLGQAPSPTLLDEINLSKEELFRALLRESAELYPGVIELLSGLHQARYKQAIASSAPQENIEIVLEKFNLVPYFDATVSGHSLPSKPDPGVFLLASQRLQIPAGNCIVIEDSFAGIQAANQAGMRCVAVATTHPLDALGDADIAVNDLEELGVADIQRMLKTKKRQNKHDRFQ
ncbi:MAG: HAD family hydrolase [Anaerolineales bacterium]